MLDTSQYRRRRDDQNDRSSHGSVSGRRVGKDRRASPSEQLARVEQDLRRTGLRFSADLEKRFEHARQPERVRHFVRTSLVGLFIYDLFLFTDWLMLPDIFRLSRLIHFGLVTPVGILIAYLMHRRWLPAESVAGTLTLILGGTLFLAYTSHSPDAVLLSFAVMLMLLFSNIVLPLPFPVAAGYSFVTAVATACCINARPGMGLGVRIFTTLLEVNLSIFTLTATYRMERSERRSYLLTLREILRGETLVEQNRELSDLSETDGLTGVPNRRAFDRSLERLWNEHLQSRTPIALIMIDIDHFKRLNDTYGHNNGDICLRKAADRLRALMRAHQTLSRYGGEEFAVLLEGEGAYQAGQIAERLRAEIASLSIVLTGREHEPHHITISLGCATVIPRHELAPEDLFISADKALYTAKHEGRNRVHTHSLDPQRPPAPEMSTPVAASRTPSLTLLDALAKN